jgi:hypothetical protein
MDEVIKLEEQVKMKERIILDKEDLILKSIESNTSTLLNLSKALSSIDPKLSDINGEKKSG